MRFRFCNIPKLESFINRRTATYIGKIARSNEEELPKKFLGAWMHRPRKIGGPQLSCNNNFARAVSAIVPNIQSENRGLLFKDWIPLALNESEWLNSVNAYFESCKTMEEDHEKEVGTNSADSDRAENQNAEKNNDSEERRQAPHTAEMHLSRTPCPILAHTTHVGP